VGLGAGKDHIDYLPLGGVGGGNCLPSFKNHKIIGMVYYLRRIAYFYHLDHFGDLLVHNSTGKRALVFGLATHLTVNYHIIWPKT
jgi:hypothetical protein